jgi:hypothetical protein
MLAVVVVAEGGAFADRPIMPSPPRPRRARLGRYVVAAPDQLTPRPPGAATARRQTPPARRRVASGANDFAFEDWFNCCHCGQPITAEAHGTAHRNHCPQCLWSKHVDDEPGDRASDCGGGMEPIAVWSRPGGDWAVIHRCRSCGVLHSNRIAGDDNELLLVALATRAIALPPFPLSRLER